MFAATNNWLGGNGSWQDKNSWSLHQRPDSDQDMVITNAGTFRFKKKLLFIANSLKQHTIGLEEVGDGIWSIHFCHVLLGRLDERDCIIRG